MNKVRLLAALLSAVAATFIALLLLLAFAERDAPLLFATVGVAVLLLTIGVVGARVPAYRSGPLPKAEVGSDDYYMQLAFAQIGRIFPFEGLPVGCVIVAQDGRVVARAANKLESRRDPTAHAEYAAIDKALSRLRRRYPWKNPYLDLFRDVTLYTTLEPCPMCAGKIAMLQFGRIVFAAYDRQWGAMTSVLRMSGFPQEVVVEKRSLDVSQHFTSAGARDEMVPKSRLDPDEGVTEQLLWDIGRRYAATFDCVPSLLSLTVKKVRLKLRRAIRILRARVRRARASFSNHHLGPKTQRG